MLTGASQQYLKYKIHCYFSIMSSNVFVETDMQMVVTWTTYNSTDSVVEFGSTYLSNVVKGQVTKFFDANDTNRIWYIHRVTLQDLKPGMKYCKYDGFMVVISLGNSVYYKFSFISSFVVILWLFLL